MSANLNKGNEKWSLESPLSFLKKSITKEYTLSDFRADFLSGLVVSLVAIPLGLSLAISAGVSPEVGLYTIITAGLVAAIFGGSKFQITGPTAAFVAILLPIFNSFGYQGLILTTFMAGIILLIMGYCRFGKVIKYIPYPVTTGFTSGIGVVILTLQIKDFLGLNLTSLESQFIERIISLASSMPSFSLIEAIIGVSTLFLLVIWRKFNKKIPSPAIVLPLVSLICFFITKINPSFEVSTIMSTFSNTIDGVIVYGIPKSLPSFVLPWDFLADKSFIEVFQQLKILIFPAFTIAILASIESLLSAVVADGITNTKHSSNSELIGLGIGNVFGSFFGAIPATGAVARTVTNIKFGAKTQISAMVHALSVLLIMIFGATMISYIPMSALAALLIIVSFDMMNFSMFKKILFTGSKSDAFVLVSTFLLTILFDMVTGVFVGIVLAAFLFMKRMADVTCGCILPVEKFECTQGINADNIICYNIDGPMFFGAADKAVNLINNIMDNVDTVIFTMCSITAMDITGLTALENSIKKLQENNKKVIFAGIQPQPQKLMKKSEVIILEEGVNHFENIKAYVKKLRELS